MSTIIKTWVDCLLKEKPWIGDKVFGPPILASDRLDRLVEYEWTVAAIVYPRENNPNGQPYLEQHADTIFFGYSAKEVMLIPIYESESLYKVGRVKVYFLRR